LAVAGIGECQTLATYEYIIGYLRYIPDISRRWWNAYVAAVPADAT